MELADKRPTNQAAHLICGLQTHFLVHVVRIQILQRCGEHPRRSVSIDEGQALPSLQVTVGLLFILVRGVMVTTVRSGLGRFLVLLFLDAPLDVSKRLRGEFLEAVRSWRCKKGRGHVFILQLFPLYLFSIPDIQL